MRLKMNLGIFDEKFKFCMEPHVLHCIWMRRFNRNGMDIKKLHTAHQIYKKTMMKWANFLNNKKCGQLYKINSEGSNILKK